MNTFPWQHIEQLHIAIERDKFEKEKLKKKKKQQQKNMTTTTLRSQHKQYFNQHTAHHIYTMKQLLIHKLILQDRNEGAYYLIYTQPLKIFSMKLNASVNLIQMRVNYAFDLI